MEETQIAPLEVVGTGALEALSKAEIDTQIATAKRYPRNIAKVKSAMLSVATLDEETAAACFYTVPRGGKNVQGPSVRMAEIALSAYGNVKAATRILSVDTGATPHAVVQAVVIDLENNVAFSVEKRRRITAKRRNNGKVDDDDIQLAVNAGSAIAFRDAVFKVVPGAVTKAVYEAAKKVAVGDLKSLAVQREKIVGRLKQMGASEDRIFAVLGVKKLEEVTLEHIETLIGIGTSLKDGNITLEEAFPPVQADEARPVFRAAPQNPTTATGTAPAKPAAPAPADDDQIPGAEVPPTATAAAPAPATQDPTALPANSPQAELAAMVTGAGFDFDLFIGWASSQGLVQGSFASFLELPTTVASRFVRSKVGMLRQLTALKAQKEGGAL